MAIRDESGRLVFEGNCPVVGDVGFYDQNMNEKTEVRDSNSSGVFF